MQELNRTYYQVSIQLQTDRAYAARWQRNAAFLEALRGGSEEKRGARFQIGRLIRRFSFGFPRRTRQSEQPATAPLPCYSPVEPVR